MHPSTAKVAAMLRRAMLERGASYRQIEDITLIPKSLVGRIVTGEKAPNIDQLRKLADALDLNYLTLVAAAEQDAA